MQQTPQSELKSTRVVLNLEGQALRAQLTHLFPYNRNDKSRFPVYIWQTWKSKVDDSDFPDALKAAQESWTSLHPTHIHTTLDDDQADALIKSLYVSAPQVYEAYNFMPLKVHRADLFRYLILFAKGRTYSDIGTDALQSVWDWLPDGESETEEKIGLIVGIEADPDRPDWSDW